MQVIRACASVFASVVFVALTAIPAGAWHGSGNITAIAVNPLTPTTLYAASSDRGVFKITDGGVNSSPTGLTNAFLTALSIDHQDPSTLYAAKLTPAAPPPFGGDPLPWLPPRFTRRRCPRSRVVGAC